MYKNMKRKSEKSEKSKNPFAILEGSSDEDMNIKKILEEESSDEDKDIKKIPLTKLLTETNNEEEVTLSPSKEESSGSGAGTGSGTDTGAGTGPFSGTGAGPADAGASAGAGDDEKLTKRLLKFKDRYCLPPSSSTASISDEYKLDDLEDEKMDLIYDSITKYAKTLYTFLDVSPPLDNNHIGFIDETQVPDNKKPNPVKLCGLDVNNERISCSQLPHLFKKKQTSLIPMMYHALQGYRLLSQLCLSNKKTVREVENLITKKWGYTITQMIDKRLDSILKRNRHRSEQTEYKSTLRKFIIVINQIRFLRIVDLKYCVENDTGKNEEFNSALKKVHTDLIKREGCVLGTGSKNVENIIKNNQRKKRRRK